MSLFITEQGKQRLILINLFKPLGSDEQSKEDFGISDSEIIEEAVFSLLSDTFTADNDHLTYYCKKLASRIINNQILHKLVTSSPIIASYDKFPRLEDIENEALILTSDPYASSKYVKYLVATLQSDISQYVDITIKKIIYKDHQVVLDVSILCH